MIYASGRKVCIVATKVSGGQRNQLLGDSPVKYTVPLSSKGRRNTQVYSVEVTIGSGRAIFRRPDSRPRDRKSVV